MKPFLFTLMTLLLTSVFATGQNEAYLAYIDLYKDIAIREMERAGIPASIKLAQGILESNAGRSTLARQANNHFGIKCHSDWTGKKFYRKDDDYNDRGQLVKSCFRAYKDAEESFIAHSEFLRDPNKEQRYGFLFRIDPRDYKKWARGLKKSGYATSATYHEKLIQLIETYELHRFDLMSGTDLIAGNTRQLAAGVLVNNDVRYIRAEAGSTPAVLASRTRTPVSSILKWNEGLLSPQQQLESGERIYLQPKRNNYRDKKRWHSVREGETLYDIAQLYGLKLKSLLHKNRLEAGEQPQVNERIKIRGWKVSSSRAPETRDQLPPDPTPEILPEDDPVFEETVYLDMDEEEVIEWTADTDPPVSTSSPIREPQLSVEPRQEVAVTDATAEPAPEPAPATTPATETRIHTVAEGDTLYNISRRYGLTVAALKSANGLADNLIHIGQQLQLP